MLLRLLVQRWLLSDLFERNNFKINKTSMARSLSVEQYNQRLIQLEKLFNEYNFQNAMNLDSSINLLNKSSRGAYGWIKSARLNGSLRELNFGDLTDNYLKRKFSNDSEKFLRRFKSTVDEKNINLATLVHEMGHVLTRSSLRSEINFFNELKLIRREYQKEILAYIKQKNYKAYNDIYMGQYSGTNIDEFLAEGFTEYKLNSNPSKYARLIGDLIDNYYKK